MRWLEIEHERHGEPVIAAIHRKSQRRLREEKQPGKDGESDARDPVRFVRLDEIVGKWRGIHSVVDWQHNRSNGVILSAMEGA